MDTNNDLLKQLGAVVVDKKRRVSIAEAVDQHLGVAAKLVKRDTPAHNTRGLTDNLLFV